MKFYKKTEGVISVFLVIILVPCLFISALFVDMGRMSLSRSMAYSSADLALNTALTNYDATLNEYYGLVASCQNMDDFYEVSEEFFVRTLSSQNLTDDEIKMLTDNFQAVVRGIAGSDSEVVDLFQVETTAEVTIAPVEEANLGNATLLKEQIVEFMKYRGPVSIVSSVVGIFKNADGTYKTGISAILDAETDKPITDSKQEFHNSESAFLRDAYNTYSYLYTNYSEKKIENSALEQKITNMENAISTYQEIHNIMIEYFYNTENMTPFHHPNVPLTKYDTTYTIENVCSDVTIESEDGEENGEEGETATEEVYYITWSSLSQKKDNLSTAITNFNTAITNFNTRVSGITYSGTRNDIQYWATVDKAIFSNVSGTSNTYVRAIGAAGEKLVEAYRILDLALDCQDYGDGFPTTYDYRSECESLLSNAKNLQEKYLGEDLSASSDAYIVTALFLEDMSANKWNLISADRVIKDGKNTDTLLAEISADLIETKAYCQDKINIIDAVINGGGVKRGDTEVTLKALTDLATLATNYETSYQKYKTTVENAEHTELQQQMATDIQEYDEDEYDEVNSESVEEMRTRLTNIRNQYQNVINKINNMKYGNKLMTEITTYEAFRSAADTKVVASSIGISQSSVDNYKITTWSGLMQPNLSNGQKLLTLTAGDEHNLFLHPDKTEGEKYAVPSLYIFMFSKFGSPKDNVVDEQTQEMENAKKAGEKNNSGEVATLLYNKDAQKIENTLGNTEIKFDFGSTFDALVSLIEKMSTGNFTQIRDEAFICAYILEMFSYASYENEGLYDLYEQKNGKEAILKLDSTNASAAYKTVNTDEEGMWQSAKLHDTYNKTLTNKLINGTNNAAYRGELEYILYGNAESIDNVKAACGDIFKLRLGLNTISGFVNFWNRTSNFTAAVISSAGDTVFSLSCGVIPPAATKAVLIMVLVAAETCNDMSCLAYGFPLEIYKVDDEQWKLALLSGVSDSNVDISDVMEMFSTPKSTIKNEGEGLTYRDYVQIFVCIMVFDEDISNTAILRTGDLIQENVKKVTGNKTYSLKNSITHFKLEADLSVDPLVVNAPLFNEFNQVLDKSEGWLDYHIEAIRGY